MKILGGVWRGRALEVSRGVRPTGGRTREALFSRWQESMPECSFLDLFAGSGAIGLEATSRGAREVVLVESNSNAVRTIIRNCRKLEAVQCRVVRAILPKLPLTVSASAPFDHVFADPPYDFDAYRELLEQIGGILGSDGEAAIEHSRRVALAPEVQGLTLTEARDYGESRLSLYGPSSWS